MSGWHDGHRSTRRTRRRRRKTGRKLRYNITADEQMKPIVSNNMVSVREEDGETRLLRQCDSAEIEQVEEVEQCREL